MKRMKVLIMINKLQELLAIESVAQLSENPNPEAPFGQGVNKAFKYTLDLGKSMGFLIKNVDNYGGHIEFPGYMLDDKGEIIGTTQESIGIACHLDTVPVGDNWSKDPLGSNVEDEEGNGISIEDIVTLAEVKGKIYGRGAIDNKGPTIAVLFAMKELLDEGYKPDKNIRLILGLDEENATWEGMKYYTAKEETPIYGFVPDGV
ncbi:MAG: M20/M25/M40 family metallo-hydrolase, partial [Anaerovoracaceae bacterium]